MTLDLKIMITLPKKMKLSLLAYLRIQRLIKVGLAVTLPDGIYFANYVALFGPG